MAIITIYTIPTKLKAEFKSKCALQGLSMTKVLIKLIKDFVNAED